MASTELVAGYKYTKDDGTVTSGSKTFTNCTEIVTKDGAPDMLKNYSKAVAGNLVKGKFKKVEDLDVA